MAMFLGEISFLLELALFAAGLVLWHHGRQGSAPLLRAGGGVLVVGAVATALCTGYFLVRYRIRGDLDSAYPVPAMHHRMGGIMEGGHGRRWSPPEPSARHEAQRPREQPRNE